MGRVLRRNFIPNSVFCAPPISGAPFKTRRLLKNTGLDFFLATFMYRARINFFLDSHGLAQTRIFSHIFRQDNDKQFQQCNNVKFIDGIHIAILHGMSSCFQYFLCDHFGSFSALRLGSARRGRSPCRQQPLSARLSSSSPVATSVKRVPHLRRRVNERPSSFVKLDYRRFPDQVPIS